MSSAIKLDDDELPRLSLKHIMDSTNLVVFTLFGAFLGVNAGELPDTDRTRELIVLAIGTLIMSTLLLDLVYRAYFAHRQILGLVLSIVFMMMFLISYSVFEEITGNGHLIQAIFIAWGFMAALTSFEAVAKGRDRKRMQSLGQENE